MVTKEEVVDQLVFEKGCDNVEEFLQNASLGMIENLIYDSMSIFSKEVAKESLKKASEHFDDSANKGVILNEDNIPYI